MVESWNSEFVHAYPERVSFWPLVDQSQSLQKARCHAAWSGRPMCEWCWPHSSRKPLTLKEYATSIGEICNFNRGTSSSGVDTVVVEAHFPCIQSIEQLVKEKELIATIVMRNAFTDIPPLKTSMRFRSHTAWIVDKLCSRGELFITACGSKQSVNTQYPSPQGNSHFTFLVVPGTTWTCPITKIFVLFPKSHLGLMIHSDFSFLTHNIEVTCYSIY